MANCYCARCAREQQVCSDCARAYAALTKLQRMLDDVEHMKLTGEQRRMLADMCEVTSVRCSA